MFFAKILRHTRQNAITEGDLECILTRNCEGTEQLQIKIFGMEVFMKTKANPQAVILFLTGLLFAAGIFYIGFRTNRQIHSATSELNSFTEQVTDLQKSLNNAHSSYADAIQSEKDMSNWRARKAAGVTAPSQESSEGSTSSESQSSVFSQNTSPEYNSFTDDYPESDISPGRSEDTPESATDSESIFSDNQPVA